MLQKPFFVNIFTIKRMDFYEVNGDVIDSILAFCIFYLTNSVPSSIPRRIWLNFWSLALHFQLDPLRTVRTYTSINFSPNFVSPTTLLFVV